MDRRYSKRYDADYNAETGKWLEKKCSDPMCCYCANRPEKARIRKKVKK